MTILFKYANFANIFFLNFIVEYFKHIEINNYLIDLVNSQQLFFEPIYNSGTMVLKNLKTYFKTKQTYGFI